MELLHQFIDWILATVHDWGYLGIFVLMGLESTVLPVPSEAVLIPAGYLAYQGKMSFALIVLASTFGSLQYLLVNGERAATGNFIFNKDVNVKGSFYLTNYMEVGREATFNRQVIIKDGSRVRGISTVEGPTSFYNIVTTSSGVQNREVVIPNQSAQVNWDWRYANSFRLLIRRKGMVIHFTPTLPANAAQVNLLVQQPSNGFYPLQWSDKFKWSSGVQGNATQNRGAVDLFSFHYSPSWGKIAVAVVQNLFYST